jgi:hypothetical protein
MFSGSLDMTWRREDFDSETVRFEAEEVSEKFHRPSLALGLNGQPHESIILQRFFRLFSPFSAFESLSCIVHLLLH